jgi:hypothetical protein
MKLFCRGKAVRGLVREQIVGRGLGARVALAFMRVHLPAINLEVVGRGLPPSTDHGRIPMEAHYEAAAGPVANIVRLVECETQEELRRRGGGVE